MSARAAWRLESLGFSAVYRYPAGKVDWLSSGLPSDGELTGELRIGSIAHTDVAQCRLGQRVGEIQSADGLCVVVNDARVVLGDLRGEALNSDPETRVEDVMNPGPSTYRPNVSVHQMAHEFLESGARRVLVTDGDGGLIGVLRREDVERALSEHHSQRDGPILASKHQ